MELKPEACYELKPLSYDDVFNAFVKGQAITAYVEEILEEKQELLIHLGYRLYGYLPFSEVTVYPFAYSHIPDRTLPVQIYTLQHKKIRVKVTHMDNAKIYLSRKENMIEAYNYLKDNPDVYLRITSLRHAVIFGDVGDGVTARLGIKDISKCRIHSCFDCFKPGDSIKVNLFGPGLYGYDFSASCIKAYPKYSPLDFKAGDIVVGTLRDPVDCQKTGYYIDIAPNIAAIMDTPFKKVSLHYGDTVMCSIKKATNKGLHLFYLGTQQQY